MPPEASICHAYVQLTYETQYCNLMQCTMANAHAFTISNVSN